MDFDSPQAKEFLHQLYQTTGGNTDSQVSMFDVGAAMGLERDAAGKVAEDLIGNGLVEVKTLSGGIGITVQGIAAVDTEGDGSIADADDLALNSGPVLDDDGRKAVDAVLSALRDEIAKIRPGYDQLEGMIIDVKTIDVQLLSPEPKTAILREVLFSLQSAMQTAGSTAMAERLRRLAGR